MNGVATLTIEQVQAGLAARKFSAVELAQSALEFAQAENRKTNTVPAFFTETRLGAENASTRKSRQARMPGHWPGSRWR